MNPHDDERGLRLAAGGNRFAFTSMIRDRAHDLAHGAPPQVVTRTGKPVSIAIVEAATGHLGASAARVKPVERANDKVVVCVECCEMVTIRRKAGGEVRGRPPSRCRAHGLSPSWEQIDPE